jgi:transposase-like protein
MRLIPVNFSAGFETISSEQTNLTNRVAGVCMQPADKWDLDELFLKINGTIAYLRRP